jgi:hypothetical protein
MRGIILISLLMMLIHTTSIRSEEVTTSNILNQNFDSGEWSGTADGRHGSNIIAAHNGDYIQSDSYSLTTDVGLTEAQIQNGFTTNHSFKYWHWNDYNSTVESTLTITGQDETITQNRTYDSVGCGSINCGSYVTGSDSIIVQRNTESDYSVDVRYDFSDTSNSTGHWSVDLKEPSVTITYESQPISTSIQNKIVEIFDDLGDEFEEIEQIVEEFFFEEKIEMKEEIKMEEPVMVMMEIKEEEKFEEPPMFEEMVLMEEKPKEEEEPAMEMMTQLFTEEKEEKEELDNSATEGIIEVVQEESKEEEKNEQPEEIQEEESNSETTQTANASEKSNTKQKSVQSKETKQFSHSDILDKIDEKIKDVGKNLELKNLVTIKAMSDTDILLSAYNVPFYKPKDIYLDQLDISDGREIYTNVTLNRYVANDPIAIRANKINELEIERQQLLIQLEVLKNEL